MWQHLVRQTVNRNGNAIEGSAWGVIALGLNGTRVTLKTKHKQQIETDMKHHQPQTTATEPAKALAL